MADGLVKDDLLVDTDERRALRAAVAKLVGGYGRGYFQDVTRRGERPDELWADLGRAGYLGVHLPEEHGGGGGGLVDLAIVIEETSAQGCPLFMLVISPAIAGSLLTAHASDEQKRTWLPGVADGTKRIAFAITEPDAGTNTHNITTTLHPDGEGAWRIRGQKYWTSGIDDADAVIVVARGAEPEAGDAAGRSSTRGSRGRHPISMFLVPTDAEGLSFTKIDSALQIPENQFTTFFDDVRVTRDDMIGVEGAGLRQVFAGLNPERVTAAAQANGIARYALARASRYATDRTVWDTPIGAHQGLSHPLAACFVDVQLARLMTHHAAQLTDAGADPAATGSASTVAKYAAGEAVAKAVDQAIQTHGGNGLSNEYGLADLWFAARMFRTAPVSREMVLNHVAQHNLGLPKSY